jgi:tetratricopeptide (TPR) repeat protein
MSPSSRIGSAAILSLLSVLTGCATSETRGTQVSTAQKAPGDGGLDIAVVDSLFEVPGPKSARSTWIAYGGFRLLWEGKHDGDDPGTYRETPEEILDATDFVADVWQDDKDHKQGEDTYLDTLAAVRQAGYLKEYVWECMAGNDWGAPPADLKQAAFFAWMQAHATNFDVYSVVMPEHAGKKMQMVIHEPIAVGYCMPPKAAAPAMLSLPDADAKINAVAKLLEQQSDSEQISTLLGQAVAAYQAAIAKRGGTAHCFYTVAEYYGYRNQHPDENTLVVAPGYCDALHVQGYMQSSLQNWDAARSILQDEHAMAPYSPGSLTELGYVTQATAGPASAVTVYWNALKLAEADPSYKTERTGVLRRLGEAFIDLKQYDAAKGALTDALANDPADVGTKRELKYLEQVSGKH